ncbi:MAG: hypothetical protein HQL52_16365 [Magnetococcales bacterium]|nr:hypothetical protein [Magnetococcales bacterium]
MTEKGVQGISPMAETKTPGIPQPKSSQPVTSQPATPHLPLFPSLLSALLLQLALLP